MFSIKLKDGDRYFLEVFPSTFPKYIFRERVCAESFYKKVEFLSFEQYQKNRVS